MNIIPQNLIKHASEEAVYNVYLYLINRLIPDENESFHSIINKLESTFLKNKSGRDFYRYKIIKEAIDKNVMLAFSKISNITVSKNGLTCCTFTKPSGDISVIFKGTGSGEWIDNGEGLSGIPEQNTYITYSNRSSLFYEKTVENDYATDQQVEALNWFRKIASKNNWDTTTDITISGHSKGGNKAQFITIYSELIKNCYSYDGQGFSPEALNSFKTNLGSKYYERREKIYSFSTENDYVNVLGKRIMPKDRIYFFESKYGFHYPEALLDNTGNLNPQTTQGKLSGYVESVSNELMSLNPAIRKYATLGVMNIFQKYLGKGIPVNEDHVSLEKTVAGLSVAVGVFLKQLKKIK